LDGLFPSQINGTDVVSTIELDISTGDEGDLADALGLANILAAGGNIPLGFDLSPLDGQVPQGVIQVDSNGDGIIEFVPFSEDGNGDFDVTATAAQFVALGFADDGDTDTPNEGFSNLAPLVAAACARDTFVEEDFLDGEINGNLITNIDSDGNVIAEGTGNTFITFEDLCLPETLLGREFVAPSPEDATVTELVQSVDIEEETFALYGQIDFASEFEGLPFRGNVGLRYVDTTVTSNSFRGGFEVETDDEGNVTGLDAQGRYQ